MRRLKLKIGNREHDRMFKMNKLSSLADGDVRSPAISTLCSRNSGRSGRNFFAYFFGSQAVDSKRNLIARLKRIVRVHKPEEYMLTGFNENRCADTVVAL